MVYLPSPDLIPFFVVFTHTNPQVLYLNPQAFITLNAFCSKGIVVHKNNTESLSAIFLTGKYTNSSIDDRPNGYGETKVTEVLQDKSDDEVFYMCETMMDIYELELESPTPKMKYYLETGEQHLVARRMGGLILTHQGRYANVREVFPNLDMPDIEGALREDIADKVQPPNFPKL